MRLPMLDGKVDLEQTASMVDAFLDCGFNYFDTAHGYINGMSETALRDCLCTRYQRERFLLTDKLTGSYFKKEEDIRPFFDSQLQACGVDYFDFYLMHAQNAKNFEQFKACRAYETAFALKKEGKIRHVGLSFHDTADVLDRILTTYPEIEFVQIQLNYVDFEDPGVQSRKVYEVCEKHNKPVIVMEPVKGGSLVNLPADAQAALDRLREQKQTTCSNAGYAIRFAAGFPNIAMVLSGMSTKEQMDDNLNTMKDFRPLDNEEKMAISQVCAVFHSLGLIPCTGCSYCVEENHCPRGIQIPKLFSCYNTKTLFHSWNQDFYYQNVLVKNGGRAADCIKCGKCEKVCPQHLPIRQLLEDVSREFDRA